MLGVPGEAHAGLAVTDMVSPGTSLEKRALNAIAKSPSWKGFMTTQATKLRQELDKGGDPGAYGPCLLCRCGKMKRGFVDHFTGERHRKRVQWAAQHKPAELVQTFPLTRNLDQFFPYWREFAERSDVWPSVQIRWNHLTGVMHLEIDPGVQRIRRGPRLPFDPVLTGATGAREATVPEPCLVASDGDALSLVEHPMVQRHRCALLEALGYLEAAGWGHHPGRTFRTPLGFPWGDLGNSWGDPGNPWGDVSSWYLRTSEWGSTAARFPPLLRAGHT